MLLSTGAFKYPGFFSFLFRDEVIKWKAHECFPSSLANSIDGTYMKQALKRVVLHKLRKFYAPFHRANRTRFSFLFIADPDAAKSLFHLHLYMPSIRDPSFIAYASQFMVKSSIFCDFVCWVVCLMSQPHSHTRSIFDGFGCLTELNEKRKAAILSL